MFGRKTIFSLLVGLILLFAIAGISEANFEVTIGTRFTIKDFGFGTKKPKVFILYHKKPGVDKKVYAKVEQWSDTSITCLWTKPVPAGTYNLWVQTKANTIDEHVFTIMPPIIDQVTPDTLTPGETITINGEFFTDKKPTVYLKNLVTLKKKRCRVTKSTMDPATGASSLNFIVPKWESGKYEINLQTHIGKTSFGPLDNWHWRNPIPQGNILHGASYGNGTFVAVGDNGTILTSPDGITWTSGNPETTNQLLGVTYGDGMFVIVGESGAIFTSPDGVMWTSGNPGTSNSLRGITYGNGMFVAVGDNGAILTSPDGITWTSGNSGTSNSLRGVTYGNGTFVAVGLVDNNPGAGTILTSPDGVTWTSRNPGGNPYLLGVTYGNGIFVAVGPMIFGGICGFFTSPDGVTWTWISSIQHSALSGVTYGNGTFVAVGIDGTIIQSDPMK